jgi:ATP-dependent protease ClpP protease subunit
LPQFVGLVEARYKLVMKIHSRQIFLIDTMHERSMNLLLLPIFFVSFLVVAYSAMRAEAAEVTGRIGCSRNDGGVCLADNRCLCSFRLQIDGEIDSTNADKVKSLLASRRVKSVASEWLSINSRGGSINTAMTNGRMFRTERVGITVDPKGLCVSACVLILAGAVDRIVTSGKIGIHRPYLKTMPQRSYQKKTVRESFRMMLQGLRAYLREMNVSVKLADDMAAVAPERIRFLTHDDLNNYGLSGIDSAEQQIRVIGSENRDIEEAVLLGLDRREYTRRKALGIELCSLMSPREAFVCKNRVLATGQ